MIDVSNKVPVVALDGKCPSSMSQDLPVPIEVLSSSYVGLVVLHIGEHRHTVRACDIQAAVQNALNNARF